MAEFSNISGNVDEPVVVLGPGEEEGTLRVARLGAVETVSESDVAAADYSASSSDTETETEQGDGSDPAGTDAGDQAGGEQVAAG